MTVETQLGRAIPDDFADLFSEARLDCLRETGRDFLEGGREGPYVYDAEGARYIDCIGSAGIYNLGRRQPELIAELRRAMRETDQGNFPLVSAEKAALAKALAGFTPDPLECSVFSVMRGEAMEFACKVARGFTARPELLTVDGGWYGQTGFALSLSQREDKELYGPLVPGVRTMPFGDIEAAKAAVGPKTAAVILEPVQAENHCRRADGAYLKALAALCHARGALLVLDETQTNFGRTGAKFAFERSGVVPDVLILGEALGGGVFPIAATVITQRVNAFMNAHPMIHLSTFGGSDVGCCVAGKALEIYERDKPWLNAAAMGRKLLSGIEELARRDGSPIQGVEGEGLLLSLALGSEECAIGLCRRAAKCGLLVAQGEVAKHMIVLRPSLTISEEQTEEILAALKAATAAD